MKILSPEFQCVLPQRATRRQLWKENHACYPGLTSMKKKRPVIKVFWFMLCRAEEECSPPGEWDGEKAKVCWEQSQVGCCGALLLLLLVWPGLPPDAWNRVLAPEGKAFPHLSCRDGGREGMVRIRAPKGRTAVVSNRFALIPHFTTEKITSESYWKSLVFLFGLVVPSARSACKKQLATLICKSFKLFG